MFTRVSKGFHVWFSKESKGYKEHKGHKRYKRYRRYLKAIGQCGRVVILDFLIGSRLTRFMITLPCQVLRDVNRRSDIKFTVIFYLPSIHSQNVFDRLNLLDQNQFALYHVSSNGL